MSILFKANPSLLLAHKHASTLFTELAAFSTMWISVQIANNGHIRLRKSCLGSTFHRSNGLQIGSPVNQWPMFPCLLTIPEGDVPNMKVNFKFFNLTSIPSLYLSWQSSTWLVDTVRESAADYKLLQR